MAKNAEAAIKMFQEGHNCAQAILACCGKDTCISRETALAIAGPFGGGLGGLGNVCDAVSGAFMVIGLKHPRLDPKDAATKQATTRLVKDFAARFTARNGSILCRDLLGYDLSKTEDMQRVQELGLIKTVCPRMVSDAAELLDEILE